MGCSQGSLGRCRLHRHSHWAAVEEQLHEAGVPLLALPWPLPAGQGCREQQALRRRARTLNLELLMLLLLAGRAELVGARQSCQELCRAACASVKGWELVRDVVLLLLLLWCLADQTLTDRAWLLHTGEGSGGQ